MKNVIIGVMLTLLGFNVQAQLVLTEANTAFTAGPMQVKGAVVTGFNVPLSGADMQWNYSGLSVNGTYTLNYTTPADTNFPTATYADTGTSVLFIPGKYYYRDTYYRTSADGANTLGLVIREQRYGNISANPSDSCIIPYQVCHYTQNSYLMPFPTTMDSSWQSITRVAVGFDLSVAALGLSHASCQKVTNTTRTDEIIGWGKMRIPVGSGVSLNYDVLMQKRTVVQVDSFYLEGAPAPAQFLSAFGVTQGQTTTNKRYLFWRENGRYPLLHVNFGENNFTVPSSVYFDSTAQIDVSAIDESYLNQEVTVFPTPNAGVFMLSLKNTSNTQIVIDIYNLSGQQVYTEKVNCMQNTPVKVVATGLPDGVYILNINSPDRRYVSKLNITK